MSIEKTFNLDPTPISGWGQQSIGMATKAPEPQLLDLDDDTPLAPVCDLSGDGTCEACQ